MDSCKNQSARSHTATEAPLGLPGVSASPSPAVSADNGCSWGCICSASSVSLSTQQALNVVHYVQNSPPWAGRPSFAVKTLQGFVMSIVTADQYTVFLRRLAGGMLGGTFLNFHTCSGRNGDLFLPGSSGRCCCTARGALLSFPACRQGWGQALH